MASTEYTRSSNDLQYCDAMMKSVSGTLECTVASLPLVLHYHPTTADHRHY